MRANKVSVITKILTNFFLFLLNEIYKAAEATGKFIGNKISDTVAKLLKIVKPVEEKIIPQKKEEILNELRGVLKNWNNMKYLNY